MTIIASTPIANARRILNDEKIPYRSADTELIAFFNECMGVMVDLRPDLFVVSTTHTCTLGAEQALTTPRVRQIKDVPRIVNGAAVFETNKTTLDQLSPGWYADTPAAAMNWLPHLIKQRFYVDPPAPAGQVLEVLVIQTPAAITATTQSVDLPENYSGAITAYLVNRISSKDDESVNGGRAALFMNDFAGMLGISSQASPPGA